MILFYISLSTYLCFTILKYKKTLSILSKNKYNTPKYRKWMFENYKETFINKEMLAVILIIILLLASTLVNEISMIVFYTLMFLLEYKNKVKLKISRQSIPRLVIIIIFFLGINVWFILDNFTYQSDAYIYNNFSLYYIILIMMSYLSYIIVWITNILSIPFDKKHRR